MRQVLERSVGFLESAKSSLEAAKDEYRGRLGCKATWVRDIHIHKTVFTGVYIYMTGVLRFPANRLIFGCIFV